jgi:prolyl 4-hydroxylase
MSCYLRNSRMKQKIISETIFTIDDFWSSEECDILISKSEKIGYEPATVNTEKGPRLIQEVRNNNRIIYKDFELAHQLWTKLSPYAPKSIGYSKAIGLNELFRFYKYEPGQVFRRHRDQSYIRGDVEASYYTFMIYLNDDYEGGETIFNEVIIRPKKGSALIFLHDLEHEGSEVRTGIKYVLRTDIMFRLDI